MNTPNHTFTSFFADATSAGDFADHAENIVKPGYIHKNDVPNKSVTYLWKIDNVQVLIKNRQGVCSPLFHGPEETVWRLDVDWGTKGTNNSNRFLLFTLTFIGEIHSQLYLNAGYEVFKGEEEFKRGKIVSDGKAYVLGHSGNSDGQIVRFIDWTYPKDLEAIIKTSVVPGGSLYVGALIKILPDSNQQAKISRKTPLFDIPSAKDLLMIGKDGEGIHAHKYYISNCSSVLKNLVRGSGTDSVLRFETFRTGTLKLFVGLIYDGGVDEHDMDGYGTELLRFVSNYEVKSLVGRICVYLERHIWREGVIDVFQLANSLAAENESCKCLRDAATRIIYQDMLRIFEGNEGDTIAKPELEAVRMRVTELQLKLINET